MQISFPVDLSCSGPQCSASIQLPLRLFSLNGYQLCDHEVLVHNIGAQWARVYSNHGGEETAIVVTAQHLRDPADHGSEPLPIVAIGCVTYGDLAITHPKWHTSVDMYSWDRSPRLICPACQLTYGKDVHSY